MGTVSRFRSLCALFFTVAVMLCFEIWTQSNTLHLLSLEVTRDAQLFESHCNKTLPSNVYKDAMDKAVKPTTKNLLRNQEIPGDVYAAKTLEEKLKYIAPKKQVMVFPIDSNAMYFEITLNLIASLLKHNVRNFLPICFQDITQTELQKLDVFCHRVSDLRSDEGHAEESVFRGFSFKEKERVKFNMASQLLSLGYSVAVVDVDIVFLQNPFSHFLTRCPNCDLMFQSDDPIHQWNVGILFAKANRQAKKVIDDSIQVCDAKENKAWVYQTCFNYIRTRPGGSYKAETLDPTVFAFFSPAYEKTGRLHPSVPSPRTVSIHITWSVGANPKYLLLREHNIWYLDTCNYYSSPTTKYMTYSNPAADATEEDEVNAVRSALNIAKVLGRKLILPPFRCNSLSKPPCKTLHYLLSINHINTGYPDFLRESTFLNESKPVPADVKSSKAGPYIIYSSTTRKLLHGQIPVDHEHTFVPKDVTNGATSSEINRWFGDTKASIVHFHSLYGAFSSFSLPDTVRVQTAREFNYLIRDKTFQSAGNKMLIGDSSFSLFIYTWHHSLLFLFELFVFAALFVASVYVVLQKKIKQWLGRENRRRMW